MASSRRPSPVVSGNAERSWSRGVHFSLFSFLMMGLLVMAVVVLAPTIQEYLSQQQQVASQQRVVSDLTTQLHDLNSERARWNDPSYVEAQARARLFYVVPGQTSYLVIDDRPAHDDKKTDRVSATIQKTHSDWVGSLVDSFMGSGLAPSTTKPSQ